METALEEKLVEITDICPMLRETRDGQVVLECTYKKSCDYQRISLGKRYCKKTSRSTQSYEE